MSTPHRLKQWLRALRRRPGYARREAVVLGVGIWVVLWLLRLSTRLRVSGAEPLEANWRERRPMVLAFWHGRSMMLPFLVPRSGERGETYIMNSMHRDGEIITRALVRFGISTTRGSSSRSAVPGTLGLMRALSRGAAVALIPDGPRGPSGVAQAGAVELAARTGSPLYPIAFSATRAVRMKGWDRMMLPLPGARVVCVVGEPLQVPAGRLQRAERERLRDQLERALVEVTHVADRACGRREENA